MTATARDRYVRSDIPATRDHRLEWIEHLDGVEWFHAPVPRRRHRCWPQTRGWMNRELVERCACGALAFDGDGVWIDRNSRTPPPARRRWWRRGRMTGHE